MINYIKAENLKLKRTFTKKLVVIMPLISLLIALLSPIWYEINAFNWWYTIILPGYIALLSFLVHQKEEKKLNYTGVMCLHVDLKKVWMSKVLLLAKFIFISCIILSLGILPGGVIFPITNTIPAISIIIAGFVIAITSVWQIPLCLFIAKKAGILPTIFINTLFGIVLNLFTVDKGIWIACPYSFTSRLMAPILGILPNGTLGKANSPLLNTNVIFPGVVLSIILFLILTFITSYWFSNQEVK